jgi:hypothetical protein
MTVAIVIAKLSPELGTGSQLLAFLGAKSAGRMR